MGGILFFGVCKVMLVFVELSILDLFWICINGGCCGYFVGIELCVLIELFVVCFV